MVSDGIGDAQKVLTDEIIKQATQQGIVLTEEVRHTTSMQLQWTMVCRE